MSVLTAARISADKFEGDKDKNRQTAVMKILHFISIFCRGFVQFGQHLNYIPPINFYQDFMQINQSNADKKNQR